MDFTKKVNDFGLFGNVLVVNNDIMESVSTTKTEENKKSPYDSCSHHQ